MARIRTIKPEFFTSEDIVSLSPLARLLYIALWCEADREGRFVWKPKTFKMRYFPADNCNIEKLCEEIRSLGLVMVYEVNFLQYGFIPSFHAHQHINPREQKTQLPDPPGNVFTTREARDSDASPRDSDVQGGREGKGKEVITPRVDDAETNPGFAKFWETWPTNDRKQAKGKCLDAWKKASAERDAALVIDHVTAMKSSREWLKNDGEFVPAPLVYLNQRRWEGAEARPSVGMFAGAI
jgi:hypothetical protein